ncbi:HD-GYP domain-containing protein [Halioglobus japonicus]|uniref:HD-GYP domain-containing protein n=1 Tax=Halioglobus japonicus TaxID=930805 RepID=UPI001F0B1DBB|nr:HD domain-containing phosphohydrolase [Halioglobus japonicus]
MLQTLKVSVSDLAMGMFVSGLDRPWLGTPFYTQGFLLESDDDLRQVRELCNFVYIDTRKSRYITPKIARQGQVGRNRIPLDAIFTGRNLTPYRDANDWKDEHPRAKAALDKLVVDISDIYDQAAVRGKIDAVRIKKVASPLIDSISRNPDACLWLGRLKQHDEYSYHHSISTTIWAIALGRQLGMQRHDLRSLAVGGMLMDVGKLLVDPELLRAERTLTPEEMREVRHHVAHGVHLVKKSGIQNQDVLDMVGFHHERWDGSGYPRGLSGDNIPPLPASRRLSMPTTP